MGKRWLNERRQDFYYRKAKQLTGWTPQYDFQRGLTDTIAWISQHLDLYQAKRYAI